VAFVVTSHRRQRPGEPPRRTLVPWPAFLVLPLGALVSAGVMIGAALLVGAAFYATPVGPAFGEVRAIAELGDVLFGAADATLMAALLGVAAPAIDRLIVWMRRGLMVKVAVMLVLLALLWIPIESVLTAILETG
jgi:hypothetical protein